MGEFHDFGARLGEGERAERHLDAFFRSRGVLVTMATQAQQHFGIDRIFQSGTSTSTIDYKADTRMAQTRNAFVETISVNRPPERLKLGWAITSRADHIIYYVPPWNKLWRIPLHSVRLILPEWLERFATRAAFNQDYETLGVIVPFDVFTTLATEVLDVPPLA